MKLLLDVLITAKDLFTRSGLRQNLKKALYAFEIITLFWAFFNVPFSPPFCSVRFFFWCFTRSVCLSIYPSVCLSIHPSICPSICSYIHTYMHTHIHTYIYMNSWLIHRPSKSARCTMNKCRAKTEYRDRNLSLKKGSCLCTLHTYIHFFEE